MIPQEQNVPKTVDLKLQRLTKLTDVVNKRYKKGLNDDDQVAAMFKYIDNNPEVTVIIGWDTYTPILTKDVKVGQMRYYTKK